ncbi:bifunctional nuclease 2-like isoform X1 [Zingiber officinale]|uniref:bifunctional nuclease 2-like isoform X1 n=1 Tax=Zingiber officinale TaxID=94328 RepID=UPI001C4C2FA2|nr:bifunctional nuclease 2-like isoform X1 [Zingiber officinale]XP_042441123.1 bifunctional nuclease 2-like isoform X1 [Zingiber officinale]
MGVLKGAINCLLDIHANSGISGSVITNHNTKSVAIQGGGLGYRSRCKNILHVGGISLKSSGKKQWCIHCSFSSSSDGNGSMAGNFNANDEEYVNSSVIEAVQVRSESDGFMIKMRDGRYLRCIHNSPQGGSSLDYAPHPAIVLKMEDGSDLLLPIIVMEMPSVLLMAAIRNVPIARPTFYQVVKMMIEELGWVVQVVRVTKRVNEAYFAQLYVSKVGNEKETISFDLRPSDAINLAVRCKVPVQVHRHLAYTDGMRVVEPSKPVMQAPPLDGMLFMELDRPDGQPCMETEEFGLIQNMLNAAIEERYKDAAQWRDQLLQLRKKKNWT